MVLLLPNMKRFIFCFNEKVKFAFDLLSFMRVKLLQHSALQQDARRDLDLAALQRSLRQILIQSRDRNRTLFLQMLIQSADHDSLLNIILQTAQQIRCNDLNLCLPAMVTDRPADRNRVTRCNIDQAKLGVLLECTDR